VELNAMSKDIVTALALLGNQRTVADLSPPARVLVGALDVGVGEALGLGSAVSEASAEAIAGLAAEITTSLGETIADIVGSVAEAIPLVGPFIKAMTSVITFALGSGESSAASCSRFFTTFKPTPTGSMLAGGPLVPADIFARTHGIERWYTDKPEDFASVREGLAPVWSFAPFTFRRRFLPCGPLDCRSALGMALMQITEGCIVDLRDIDWKLATEVARGLADADELPHLADGRAVRRLWGRALERDARIASLQWAKLHPQDAKRGLPKGWRDRFRRVRRGIEACGAGALPPGTTSDGGAVLWIAYLDLLARAFEPATGYLTWEYVEFLFARQRHLADRRYDFKGAARHAWHKLNEPLLHKLAGREYLADTDLVAAPPTWVWGDDPCPRMITENLRGIVENWQHSVHPAYQQGKAKLDQLDRDARAVGRAVGARRAQATTAHQAVRVGDALGAASPQTSAGDATPTSASPASAATAAATEAEDFDPTPVLVGLGALGGIALALHLLTAPRGSAPARPRFHPPNR
jgi:hypothetical protein